jgi:hypothetical protein
LLHACRTPALKGVHAVQVFSELPFLVEIPVYLLLVQNYFSRSSLRSATALRTGIVEEKNSSIFQLCKKLHVDF